MNRGKLIRIEVSEGQILGESREFLEKFVNSIKLGNELWWEIRNIIILERKLRPIHKIEITQFGIISTKKSKSEVRGEENCTNREKKYKKF